MRKVLKGQLGITGLETAIVLITFVVVSSIFVFAGLSTGIFSSDKAKETMQAGLSEARGTLEGGSRSLKVNVTPTAVTAEAVATGDGATTAFTLDQSLVIPGSQTVSVGGIAQTYGTAYTLNFDTGAVTFTTAPANGLAITAAYTYYQVTAELVNVAGNASSSR